MSSKASATSNQNGTEIFKDLAPRIMKKRFADNAFINRKPASTGSTNTLMASVMSSSSSSLDVSTVSRLTKNLFHSNSLDALILATREMSFMDASRPDEMLNKDIPNTKHDLTLFDGFRASLTLPRKRKKSRLMKEPMLLQNGTVGRKSARKLLTEIPSDDVAGFIDERDYVLKELEMTRIRKKVAESDIIEIESKIKSLEQMKKNLQQDITKYTEQQLALEDELDTANERVAALGKETPQISKRVRVARSMSHAMSPLENEKDDVPSGESIISFQAHETPIISLDFDLPHGMLVTASVDETLQVWDLSNGYCLGILAGHTAPLRCLQVEENVVVSGSNDHHVNIWDLNNTGSNMKEENNSCLVKTLEGHCGNVTSLYFAENTLATGSSDKTIRQWDMNTGQCVQTMDVLWAISSLPGNNSSRWSTSTTSNNRSSIFSTSGSVSALQTLSSLSLSTDYPYYNDYVGSLQFWKFALASGTWDGAIRMWDMRTGQVHRTLIGHTGPVTSLQFDEVNIVSGSLDKTIRIWDLRTGGVIETISYSQQISTPLPDLTLPSSAAGITCLQFDSRRVIAAVGDLKSAQVYNRTSMVQSTIGIHRQAVGWLRYQDEYLVTGGRDGVVGVWQM